MRTDFAVGLWQKWRMWINKVKSRSLEGGRLKIKREEEEQYLKQEKGEHQPVWVPGDATMPAGSECSQLSLFHSLASMR